MLSGGMKENSLRFVIFCSIVDHAITSTSQTNPECPVTVDTSDVFERIMRLGHMTSWDQVREAIDLLQKMSWTIT